MKIIHKNKKAYFDFEILEEMKAGIVLLGAEMKSVRGGDISLKGAYVIINKGEAFVKGMNIRKYSYDQDPNYEPMRERKLLLSKKELENIDRKLNEQGVTIVALFIGLDGKHAKLQIAIARGKKMHDKRQTIKDRDVKREIGRAIKKFV